MGMYKAFNTERLIIRPTLVQDADFILELFNTPKWIENIGDRNVHSVEMARDYILNKMQPQLERLGYSSYTIIQKSNKIKIGICGLYDREGLNGIDIGFAILPEYEGKGFTFEATNKLKNVAFIELGIKTIYAITTKSNFPSQKLLEKLGLKLVETTKLPNDNKDLLLYKIENKN